MAENVLDPLPALDRYYDYRGQAGVDGDAPPIWLPYHQGDVFAGVDIPGVEAPERTQKALAMLFLHPCTMRRGAVLINPVTVIQVRWFAKRIMAEAEWVTEKFSMMPLPDLHAQGSATHIGDFLSIGVVGAEVLDRSRRIATLSHKGRGLFQQRVIHHLTRLAPPLGDLAKQTRPVEREISLQADWCEAACERKSETIESVTTAELEFDGYMSQNDRRAHLANDDPEHDVMSEVQSEITRRYRRPVGA